MKKLLKFVAVFFVLLMVIAATFIMFNWQPDQSVSALKAKWAKEPSQFIDVAGMSVHIRDEGPQNKLAPVVLIHGTSSSLHTWNGWTEALKNERRVIRFDLPGFGLTGPAPDHNYAVERYAAFVVEVLDHLQVDRAVLAGNSLGGNVAWVTALLYPERIDRLVLVDSSGLKSKPQSVPLGFKIASLPVMKKLMANVLPRGLIENSVKNVYGDPSLVTEALVDRYFDLTTREGNRQALSERLSQSQPGHLAERLPELTVPTLILWGEKDRLIPPALADEFNKRIPDSELVVFSELGHVPQEEDPQQTVEVLHDFLKN